MFTMKVIKDSGVASKYYSKSDYYTSGEKEKIISEWGGEGSRILGLSGDVNIDDFRNIMDGRLPSGESLGKIGSSGVREHKKGWDLVFSAPKSVSVLALAGRDTRLVDAHQQAVKSAMRYIEKNYLVTRQSTGGLVSEVNTKNLISASFLHTTSRKLDPQLHTHNVVMNATQREDGEWRSVESRQIYEHSMLFGQIYRAELAALSKSLGYELEIDAKTGTFELACVRKDVLKAFSKRRAQIEEAAKKYGYTTTKGMDEAAVRSRDKKQNIPKAQIEQNWREEFKELGFDPEKIVDQIKCDPASSSISSENESETTSITLTEAIKNLSDREAVFSEEQLIDSTLKLGMGALSVDGIKKAIASSLKKTEVIKAALPNNVKAFTTPQALKTEKAIIQLMQKGRNNLSPVASKSIINEFIEGKGFEKGQEEAARLILSTRDRVVGIQGYAGTGKTYMLDTVREVAEQSGFTVRGFAPTGTAAEQLQQDSGIESQTLASHLFSLNNKTKQKPAHRELWVVDEAGLVNSRDMAQLLSQSKKLGARLVLVGDTKQISAIEWGKPFHQLMKSGMKFAEMKSIRRQKDSPELLNAVYSSIHGNPAQTLAKIKNTVHEIKDAKERNDAIVNHYLSLSDRERQQMLVLIPDNDTRSLINDQIQQGLRAKGLVGPAKLETHVLVSEGLTRMEKSDTRFYRKGQIVHFGRDYKSLGVIKNTDYQVMSVVDNLIQLRDSLGKEYLWNPKKVAGKSEGGVEVFKKEKRSIGEGDLIRWKKKDKKLGLKNGYQGVVEKIDKGVATVHFQSGKRVDLNLKINKQWDLGYATTIFSAQGATYKNVIVNAESWRQNLINQKTFYVGISRAKKAAHVYTNNIKELKTELSRRFGEKTAAIEGSDMSYDNSQSMDGLIQKNVRQPVMDKVLSLINQAKQSLNSSKKIQTSKELSL